MHVLGNAADGVTAGREEGPSRDRPRPPGREEGLRAPGPRAGLSSFDFNGRGGVEARERRDHLRDPRRKTRIQLMPLTKRIFASTQT